MSRSQTDPEQLPPSAGEGAGRIIRVDAARRLEAIERLVGTAAGGGRACAERFLEFSQTHAIRVDAMWAALDASGRVDAVVLAVPHPGRTAMLFTGPPASRKDVPAVAGLIDHVCHQLATMDTELAQALTEPRDTLQRDALLAGGFTELAHLSYLERPLSDAARIPPPHWPPGITVEPYREPLWAEMIDVLERSYEDTLDCPGLRGLRRTEDILTGHRATGTFDADLWTLMRMDGEPCGGLLLNRAPTNNTIELVYIGLAPAARGQGHARRLLQHGLRLCAGGGERALTLAVDERNDPALALYRREGFRRVLRRVAMIRSLRSTASRPT
ncbi:MAG: GNAT family N-acetyltransferase [Planctomycetota bacterium]|nr:GNAT family N-acetyltransferase [Planctomycetota bacterium]